MVNLSVVKLPEMEEKEINGLLGEQMICRIAFKGDDYPYISLFQYTMIEGFLYFHFTDYGNKIKLLKEDSRVCVEIEDHESDLSRYRFAVLRGELKVVEDPEERIKAIEKMAEEGKQKLSTNFLAAHGFKKEEGWKALTPEKPLVIVKLHQINAKIGLKSPE
ncbi:MAG: pyridoxamine 5'-phosphate oxidase family protein [Thermoproteota archaeon]